MAPAADQNNGAPHVPVLLRPLLKAVAPVSGTWVDGTFGAGGYARGLLEAGADKVIGIDRDPLAHQMAQAWIGSRPRARARSISSALSAPGFTKKLPCSVAAMSSSTETPSAAGR